MYTVIMKLIPGKVPYDMGMGRKPDDSQMLRSITSIGSQIQTQTFLVYINTFLEQLKESTMTNKLTSLRASVKSVSHKNQVNKEKNVTRKIQSTCK